LELITSRRNPLVARLRALHQPRGRRVQVRLLLEGTHLLQEVLRLGLTPDLLLATPDWLERHPALLAACPAAMRRVTVAEPVLEAVATTDHPDGVVLTLPPPPLPAPGRARFVLVLDRLQDPGNLGTLLRTALAAGIEEVWLAGGADPFQPKVLRASAGAALALPCRRHPDRDALVEGLTQAREAGLQLVATVVPDQAGHGEVLPYWELDWCRPTALLLGNEGAGLDPALQALASERVTIPHDRRVESLNVAVAAAPLLLERWRQRASPLPAEPSVASDGRVTGENAPQLMPRPW
jgi:TrmH family RNA methyltransferase